MAKPIISFKGIKFTAGQTTGYRPQLEKAVLVSDLALAEEICIEKRLSLSPDELMYAVKTTLETVPQLIAADGKIREFGGLLRWNRSATGRLNGIGGAWNDTCRAYVRALLLKNAKADLDAQFVNEIALPVPKLSNVTWIGAKSSTNVLKPGYAFAAYGRNMQFTTGNTAYLLFNGTEYPLTCTASDVSHATFSWPTGFPTVEAGTTARFVMSSSGGIEGGAETVSTANNVVIIGGDPAIDQTPDGVTKIMTFKCGGSSTEFTWGQTFEGDSVNLYPFMSGKNWSLDTGMMMYFAADGNTSECWVNIQNDGKRFWVDTSSAQQSIPSGTYANAQLRFCVKNTSEDRYEFKVTFPLTVP